MKRLLLPLLLPLLLLQAGCSESLVCARPGELEDFDVVQTVGVDLCREGVRLTAVTGAGSEGDSRILQAEAATIRRAMQRMQDQSEKKYIFFGETQSFLIGEEAAEKDVSVYLETVERGVDMRLDTKVYVVRGSTAAEAISAATSPEHSVNERLSAIEADVRLLSESYAYSCGEVAESLAEDGCALVSAVELVPRAELPKGEGEMTLSVPGYAVLREGALRAFVTGDEARGLTLLRNQTRMDMVEVPDGAGGLATVELTGAQTALEPVFAEGRLAALRIKIALQGNVAGMETPLDLYDPAVIAGLERSLAQVEQGRVLALLGRMRTEGQDLIGARDAIEAAHPILFRRCCEAAWPQPLLEADYELEITALLERTYDLGVSPAQEGKGGKK